MPDDGHDRVWLAGGMSGWRGDKDRIPWMKGFKGTGYVSVLGMELDALDQYTESVLGECENIRGGVGEPWGCWALGITVPQQVYVCKVVGEVGRRVVEGVSWFYTQNGDLVGYSKSAAVLFTESPKEEKILVRPVSDSVRKVSKLVCHILWQSGLLAEAHGLSPEMVITMATHIEMTRQVTEPGHHLKTFLKYFGAECDTPTPTLPHHPTHWIRIKNLFSHCSIALTRWDSPLTATSGGKSSLASIIAFNKLAVAYFQLPPKVAELQEDQPPELLDE